MKFNISKCFVMRVTQSKKYKVLYDYQLHSSTVSSVDHCKFLGVVLQSNLRWSKHIEAFAAKANSMLGIICHNIKKACIHICERANLQNSYQAPTRICILCMVTMVETGYFRAREGATSCCSFCIQLLAHGQCNRNDFYFKQGDIGEMLRKSMTVYLYKTINDLIRIPMDHYKPSTFIYTRSFHDQNLLLHSCRTDIYIYPFSPQQLDSGIPCLEMSLILDHYNHSSNYYKNFK